MPGYREVGQSRPRVDAVEKINGSARYLSDLECAECLHSLTVRSERSHARITSIELDPAFDWSQVTVVRAADIPGRNINPVIIEDQPFLAEESVRFKGEPILLLAASDPTLCRAAAHAVTIRYEELPACFTISESLEAHHPIFNDDNIFKELSIKRGDVENAFADSSLKVIEGVYATGAQEQLYLEPQGVRAEFDEAGGLLVTGSLQCPNYVLGALQSAFPELGDRIEVRQSTTGGAFGGKEDFPSLIATHAALLSFHAGKPVRMLYDREEDFRYTTKRHPSRTAIRAAVTPEGRIVALDIDFLLNAGAYATLSQVVLARGVLHAAGPYQVNNVRVIGRALATNLPPSGAFRGFGAPQAIFGIESHLERIAAELQIDPLELRERNLLRSGGTFATGQLVRNDACEQVLRQALAKSDREQVQQDNHRFNETESSSKRGIGLALFYHGAGFTGSGESVIQGKALLEGNSDGTLSIRVTSTEMGQGAATVLPQIAAETLNVSSGLIRFETPSTRHPDSGPTVASRTTMVVGKLVEKAALRIRQQLSHYSDDAGFREAVSAQVADQGLSAIGSYEPPPDLEWDDDNYRGDAYPDYSWGCYVAQVEVSLIDYSVRVLRFTALQDIGTVINPALAAGQVEGGVVQALGYTLYEKVHYDRGQVVNAGFTDYIIPTMADLPELQVDFIEYPSDRGGCGAKGVGELPMDGVAPAVAAAVRDAVGLEITRIPLLPEEMMELMCRQ